MPIPAWLLPIIAGGASGFASGAMNLLQGGQQGMDDRTYQLNKLQLGNQIRRQLDMAPLRDRLVFNLLQRTGMSPQAPQFHDIFNPSTSVDTPRPGGIDLDELSRRTGAYSGMGPGGGPGGVATDIQQRILDIIGLRPPKPGEHGYVDPNAPTPPPAGVGGGTAAPGGIRGTPSPWGPNAPRRPLYGGIPSFS